MERFMNTKRSLLRTCLLLFLTLALAAGCAKEKLIPNTKVPDTQLNRNILRVVEMYRRAVVTADAAAILALVHPTYLDNAGTPQGKDDIDYEALKELLKTQFKSTDKIRMRIEYLAVEVRGRQAEVDTWIDATFVYKNPKAQPRWRRLTDANRYRLIRDKDTWRFISGL
jgi:hypothetical protein